MSIAQRKHVIIYTDGSCIGNPGPGGYGAVLLYGRIRKELSGGFRYTTNNRMEILAAIVALEMLREPCAVTLYTDSEYLANSMMQGWAERWRQNGWKRKNERVPNADLWARLLDARAAHDVRFEWVKGHAGNPENERCDFLCRQAASAPNLPADAGYEGACHREARGDALETPSTMPVAKRKVTEEGQPCRKCGIPVTKEIPRAKNRRPGQAYAYEYYLRCPACATMYMVDAAKRELS